MSVFVHRTERGLDRVVNFSDGTVAIAITLLVLPLVDIANDHPAKESGIDVVRDHWTAFLAFAITFAVIARFWMLHHRVFERVRGYTTPLIVLNFVWLISIVFLPFAADMQSSSDFGSAPFVAGLYLTTLFVTSAALGLIEAELRRHPELLSASMPDAVGGIVTASLLAVAVIASVFFPRVGVLWVLLIVATAPVTDVVRRWVPSRPVEPVDPAEPAESVESPGEIGPDHREA